jgi:hypothetical protein
MGALPAMCQSVLQRFDVNNFGQVVEADGNPPSRWPALNLLVPRELSRVNPIGPVAKFDASGKPVRKWNYELPPMAIVGVLQSVYHIRGVARQDGFPYGLKAIGRVNAVQIMNQQGQLVSENYVIVP